MGTGQRSTEGVTARVVRVRDRMTAEVKRSEIEVAALLKIGALNDQPSAKAVGCLARKL